MDPDQLFVTEYWRQYLGIPALKKEEVKEKISTASNMTFFGATVGEENAKAILSKISPVA